MLNARNFAFIGCRLIAVYHLSNSMLTSVRWVSQTLVVKISDKDLDLSTNWARSIDYFITSIIMFVLFWFASRWISEKIVQDNVIAEEENNWTYQNIASIAISIIGFYLIVTNVPDIIKSVISGWGYWRGFGFLFYNLYEVAVGLVCVLGAKRIAGFITDTRYHSKDRTA